MPFICSYNAQQIAMQHLPYLTYTNVMSACLFTLTFFFHLQNK